MYNVLVSTSIGEEGLDIGDVDMIVCYDAQKTPIRMVTDFISMFELSISNTFVSSYNASAVQVANGLDTCMFYFPKFEKKPIGKKHKANTAKFNAPSSVVKSLNCTATSSGSYLQISNHNALSA